MFTVIIHTTFTTYLPLCLENKEEQQPALALRTPTARPGERDAATQADEAKYYLVVW